MKPTPAEAAALAASSDDELMIAMIRAVANTFPCIDDGDQRVARASAAARKELHQLADKLESRARGTH